MLLTQKIVPYVTLTTPKGIKVFIEIEDAEFSENHAKCSVKKHSGTDPDVTNGIKIFSTVRKIPSSKIVTNSQRIVIKGGEGVGRVTLPGLDQKPGESAINSVPRKMILEGVEEEIKKAFENENLSKEDDFSLEVEISVPGGEEIARQTFNPKLGIVGGISILGTSGIVEPMSEQALLDTIKLEINVRKSQGFNVLPIVPGNYGADFLQAEFGFSVETAVHCSNFVFDSLQMAKNAGFKKILFCGHIGKLVKVAGGIKNTHSKYGDHRMEIISEVTEELFEKGLLKGKITSGEQFSSLKKELLACISTEQAVNILDSIDSLDSNGEETHETRNKIMKEIATRIQKNMIEWTCGEIEIEVLIFTKEHGLLAGTSRASDFIMPEFLQERL